PKIVFEAFGSVIHRAALSPNGSLLAMSTERGAIVIVDVASGKKVHGWKLPGGADVAFAADGRHIATGNADGTVYILRLPQPEPPANREWRPARQPNACLRLALLRTLAVGFVFVRVWLCSPGSGLGS